jgi:hypothetical protein
VVATALSHFDLLVVELFACVVREDELVNTLKPLLIVAVLAGIGYGVYVRINNGSDAPPPPGAPEGWGNATVQLSDTPAPSSSPFPSTGAPSTSPFPSVAPAYGAGQGLPPTTPAARGNEAPPFAPTPSTTDIAAGAHPYAPPGQMPPNQMAPGQAPPPAYADPRGGAPPFAPEPPATDPARNDSYRDAPPADATGAAPPFGSPAAPGAPPIANAPYDPAAADRYRAAAAAAPPAGAPSGFGAAMEAARRELEGGQLSTALRQLSAWYDDPQLTMPERQQLNQTLDQVAGTVVYSTQHLLESPYEVQQGERLEDISQRYNVPWQLLAKINGIDDPQSLRAGERLKVMRGPFSAMVSLEKRQLTLLLADGSYAGRFAVGIGREQPPAEGVYAVSDKVVNPVYRGPQQTIGAGDPANPLGDRWIGLGSSLGIHGTNRPDSIGRVDLPGSISLSPHDVEDVYDILSVGSKVTIRR